MKRVIYKLYIIWLAFRWIFQINLGDIVIYNGNRYSVANGTRTEHWKLRNFNGNSGWVLRSECRKLWSLNNILHSFKAGYRFYTGYWLSIWERKGIEPWVRALPIWPWSVKRLMPEPERITYMGKVFLETEADNCLDRLFLN